jgi:hypothetical protein
MMTDERALRIAIVARDQVVANPELARRQALAWQKFVRHVWGGPPVHRSETTKPSEQFASKYDERMALGDETVGA